MTQPELLDDPAPYLLRLGTLPPDVLCAVQRAKLLVCDHRKGLRVEYVPEHPWTWELSCVLAAAEAQAGSLLAQYHWQPEVGMHRLTFVNPNLTPRNFDRNFRGRGVIALKQTKRKDQATAEALPESASSKPEARVAPVSPVVHALQRVYVGRVRFPDRKLEACLKAGLTVDQLVEAAQRQPGCTPTQAFKSPAHVYGVLGVQPPKPTTWLTPFEQVFLERNPNGVFPFGVAAKTLRPLVTRYGAEGVLAEFRRYLAETPLKFFSWPKFAMGFAVRPDLTPSDTPQYSDAF